MKTLRQIAIFGVACLVLGGSARLAWSEDSATDDGASPVAAQAKSIHVKKKPSRLFCVEGEKRTRNGCVQTVGRGLASVSLSKDAPIGQGEAMLNNVTSNSPRFMKPTPTAGAPVRLAGVCHDTDGVVYYSGQKGYSDCLHSRSVSTGNTSDYFSAYRQAGVGIQVGQ